MTEDLTALQGSDIHITHGRNSFVPGVVVLVTLNTPREKFWGAILSLNPAGASLRGVGLDSFEDFMRLVKSGESAMPNAVFFPMHRVERMEIDARNTDIPSLSERFEAKTGRPVTAILGSGMHAYPESSDVSSPARRKGDLRREDVRVQDINWFNDEMETEAPPPWDRRAPGGKPGDGKGNSRASDTKVARDSKGLGDLKSGGEAKLSAYPKSLGPKGLESTKFEGDAKISPDAKISSDGKFSAGAKFSGGGALAQTGGKGKSSGKNHASPAAKAKSKAGNRTGSNFKSNFKPGGWQNR